MKIKISPICPCVSRAVVHTMAGSDGVMRSNEEGSATSG